MMMMNEHCFTLHETFSRIYNILADESNSLQDDTLPRHIILPLGPLVFAPNPKYCLLSVEAAYNNSNVFGLTRQRNDPWSSEPC